MRATLLAAATVGLLLTACTGGASQPSANTGTASDGGGKTVKYLIEEQEDAEAFKALETHIGDFEKESGIDVTVSTLPLDTMRTVLQTQLRSGEGPDVFNWGSGPGFGGALAKAGLLMDLTDQYTANKWQVYDFAKERVTFDGKTYGVPGEMETIGIFYNKDLFSKLGITNPRRWPTSRQPRRRSRRTAMASSPWP
jgi:raffinose/stachyose/melibiose transport system substrate-binding protein